MALEEACLSGELGTVFGSGLEGAPKAVATSPKKAIYCFNTCKWNQKMSLCSVVHKRTRLQCLTFEWFPTHSSRFLASHSVPSIGSIPAARGRYRHQTLQEKQRRPTSQTGTGGTYRRSPGARSARPNRFISSKCSEQAVGSRTFALCFCVQLVRVWLTYSW